MAGNLRQVLRNTRLSEVYPLARRVAGLGYLTPGHFLPDIGAEEATRLADLSRAARGAGPAPVLVLGVMPRSGTNFLRDLIALHPDVHPDPGRLYEFPLLHVARGAAAFADEFIAAFPRNAEVLGRHEPLAMLAGAWLAEFQREAGEKRLLMKSPHVQNLSLAPHVFAGCRVFLCLRDGRDVVDSSLRTFSRWSPARKTFGQLAEEWRLSAEAMLHFAPGGRLHHPDVMLVRYEDLVDDAPEPLGAILAHAGLDPARYDQAARAALPVRGSSRSGRKADARWQPEARTEAFKSVGRWQAWSPRRKARFDRIAGDALEKAGYDRAF